MAHINSNIVTITINNMNLQKEIDRLAAEVKEHEKAIADHRDQVNAKNKKLRKLKLLVDEAAELLGSRPANYIESKAQPVIVSSNGVSYSLPAYHSDDDLTEEQKEDDAKEIAEKRHASEEDIES